MLRARDERLNEEIAGLNRVINAMNDAGAGRVKVLTQEARLEVRRAAQRLLNAPIESDAGVVCVAEGLTLARRVSAVDAELSRLLEDALTTPADPEDRTSSLRLRLRIAGYKRNAMNIDPLAMQDPSRISLYANSLHHDRSFRISASRHVHYLDTPAAVYRQTVDRLTWLPESDAQRIRELAESLPVQHGAYSPVLAAIGKSITLVHEVEEIEAANPRGAGGIDRFDPQPMRAAVTQLVGLWGAQDERIDRAVEHTLTILEPIAERRRLPELREVTRLKRATYRLLVRTQAAVEREALAALPTLIDDPDSIRTPAMVALVLRHESAVEDLVTYIAVDEALAWCLSRGGEGRAAHDAIGRVVDMIEERDEDDRAKGMALLRRFVRERERLEGVRNAISTLDVEALRLRETPSNLPRRLDRSFDQLERVWLRWWGDLSESGTLEGEGLGRQITPIERVETFDRLMRALSARAAALAIEPTASVPEGALRALSVLSGADQLERSLDFALEGQGVGVALALNTWENASAALRMLQSITGARDAPDARRARFIRWLHELDHAWTREDRDRGEVREIVEYLNRVAQ